MRLNMTFVIGWAVATATAATLSAAPLPQQSQQPPVNTVGADGTTALHRAAQWNDLASAERLIRAGANVKAANRYGVTPLSLACINGNAAMIELLLKAGADPNTTLPEGETALMTTANTGNVAALKILLAHGANVNAVESSKGQTALMWAVNEGRTAAARLLVETGADIHARSKAKFSALVFAVRGGKTDIVKILLAAGANANTNVDGTAVSAGSAEGTSLVSLAIINGQYDIAQLLLENGADPRASDSRGSLLHALAWMRRPGTRRGVPPDPVGDSLALAKALITRGANPNARIAWKEIPFDIDSGETKSPPNIQAGRDYISVTGATPYFLAAKNGDVALMRVLVANGADPRTPNASGVTPFIAAAGLGYWAGESPGPSNGTSEAERLEAVKLALDLSGEDVNGTADFGGNLQFDEDPDTLRFAYPGRYSYSSSGKPPQAEAFLGDVRWAGSTALHGAAAIGGQLSIIRFLVEKGARLDARNQLGWTPLMITQGMVIGANGRFLRESEALLKELMVQQGMDPAKYSHRAVTTTEKVVR